MQDFKDKVGVVTGAASGIGRAIAERCAQEGMKVVLADIDEAGLATAEAELRATGAQVIGVRTDVARRGDVEALAQRTLATFGGVHLLFNNAGVGAGSSPWESTWNDWEWVLGVNLWGVIHGVKVFIPIMLAQNDDCHIVNTASAAGLIGYHPSASYQVTKHAVVALSENMYVSLAQRKARVKVSVLCPGWVNTRIMDAARNRPLELQNEPSAAPPSPEREAILQRMHQAVQAGLAPREVAARVFTAIRAEQFYILTDREFIPSVQERLEDIVQQRNPGLSVPLGTT